jgi:CRISPR-associated protein Cmr2
LATGEQLDVVGLTKRLACTGDQDISYPSVARIAAASWLRLAERSPLIQDLKNECEILAQRGILSRTKDERFRTFPYDGTAIFRSRYRSIANEADVSLDMLDALRSVVKRLDGPPGDGGLGEPSPYLAILIADGDGMGAIISRLPSPEAHRAFSNSLSSFAAKAHEIVANAGGVCIYAGGDDVLAFMPLEVALSCARQLHEAFETILSGAGGLTQVPTLSVGVAVGHFMEPLEDLRDYALQAESAAKQRSGRSADLRDSEGNGLAIHVYVRSGGSLRVRERWQLGEDCLDRRLERWSGLFASKGLPGKLPYDFRKLASEYLNWPPGESLQVALAADAWRLVGRKQFQLEKADQDWFQARLDSLEAAKDLERLADQMLVAQWLAGVAAPSQTSSRSDEVLA